MYDDMIHPFGGIGSIQSEPDKLVQGGKGANLIDMSNMGLPVPPGFTISTEVCRQYEAGTLDFELLMDDSVYPMLKALEQHFGYMPLCAVRSGAPVSMPGMMDTILNVGITSQNIGEWMERLGEWTALDCYRRWLWMHGETVLGIEGHRFSKIWDGFKGCKYGLKEPPKSDTETTAKHQSRCIDGFVDLYTKFGYMVPDTVEDQFRSAIVAVFRSWNGDRARQYREANDIPDYGTAVNIVAMVFGNMDDQSCSGVAFTRNPSTGEDTPMGEFLPKAQGEDVVAGIRTPLSMQDLPEWNPDVSAKLIQVMNQLEGHYKDVQDIEFTVQSGTLYLLQTRSAKRSARAAFKIAVDLEEEGMITRDEALKLIDPKHLKALHMDMIAEECDLEPCATGLGAGGGAATGLIAMSHTTAEKLHKEGKDFIYVAKETTPNDFSVMQIATGLLTRVGGMTSHAAVVARGMNLPCVVGCSDLPMDQLEEGQEITIDGLSGRVWNVYDVPVQQMSDDLNVQKLLEWASDLDESVTLVDLNVDPVPTEEESLRVSVVNVHPDDLKDMFVEIREKNPNLQSMIVDMRVEADFLTKEERSMMLFMTDDTPAYQAKKKSERVVQVLESLFTDEDIRLVPSEFCALDVGDSKFSVHAASKTVAEALASLPTFIPSDELIAEVGGQENFDKFVEVLKASGIEKSKLALATKSRRRLSRLLVGGAG